MTGQTKKPDMKKLLIPIGAVIALIAVILTIVLVVTGKESYRLIKINSFEGGIELQREEKGSVEVFKGLQLISADTVAVGEDSFLELLADSDKHIAAEENTGFKLYSSGDEKNGNISIDLLYGKALFTIDNKLNEGSFFQVTSPNATLSVRGTTFSTEYDAEEEKTVAEVMEGTVVVTCDAGAKTLEKGDKVAVIGSGDNVRIEEITDSEYLLTLAKTYPQVEKYTEGKAEHFITVSEYTATAAGISDTVYSDSEKQGSPLLSPQSMLKGYLDSHAEEVNKYFEENKDTAVKSGKAEDKDVTEWITDKLTVGGATFIVDKAYLNISVKGKSSDAYYFTSETHKVRENGRDMYYYADGVTLAVYGSTEEKPAVTTTTTATTTAPVTTATEAENLEKFGFHIDWNMFDTFQDKPKFEHSFMTYNDKEKYSGFGALDTEKYFPHITDVIKKRSDELTQYFEENREAEFRYSAGLDDSDTPPSSRQINDWFDEVITVTDDNGKIFKIRFYSISMRVNGSRVPGGQGKYYVPDEKYYMIDDDDGRDLILDRIHFVFTAYIIEESESTVTTPVVTEAPEVTTKVTTAAPVTTTKKTTTTAKENNSGELIGIAILCFLKDGQGDSVDEMEIGLYGSVFDDLCADDDCECCHYMCMNFQSSSDGYNNYISTYEGKPYEHFGSKMFTFYKDNLEAYKEIFSEYKKNNFAKALKEKYTEDNGYVGVDSVVDIDSSLVTPESPLIFESECGNVKIDIDHIETSIAFGLSEYNYMDDENIRYELTDPETGKKYYVRGFNIGINYYGTAEKIN